MKISELAAKAGVTVATVRFYEQVGLLAKHFISRSENNYRDYSDEAVQRLIELKEIQGMAGFTIAELKEVVSAYEAGELTPEKEVAFLQHKVDILARKIAELEQAQTYLKGQLAALLQKAPFAADGHPSIACNGVRQRGNHEPN